MTQTEQAPAIAPATAPAAPPAPEAPAPGAPGRGTFRIQDGDKVVQIGPGGVEVLRSGTGQAAVDAPSPIPPEAVVISIAFFVMIAAIIIGWPIARAIGRRMDRSAVPPARGGAGDSERLVRIEQAVEAMAVEVERISENQRFVTKLMTDGGRPDAALLARAGELAARPEPGSR